MNTEPQRTCPSCGNEFSGAMEFCPVCMLRKAVAAGVESGELKIDDESKEAAWVPLSSVSAIELPLAEQQRRTLKGVMEYQKGRPTFSR
jgi:predicted amidophosphoribosyltransferase